MRPWIVLCLLFACDGGDDVPAASPWHEPELPEPSPATPATPIDRETLSALEAMGYVQTAPTDNPEDRGVTRITSASQGGYNLYSTRDRASALLLDEEGEVLHRWHARGGVDRWMHVEPAPDGSLLVVTLADYLTKVAWDSSVIWQRDIPVHHDLAVDERGRIFTLVRRRETIFFAGEELPILGDAVVVYDDEGDRLAGYSLVRHFRDDIDRERLREVRRTVRDQGEQVALAGGAIGDVLHTNSIEVLEHPIEGVAPAGSVLLSMRNLDRIAILSSDFEEVLWKWGEGELDGQHDATQLPDGRVLVFDNGVERERSRVIEVDPRTNAIDWTFEAEGFFTRLRGGAQRLLNGNTLITESDSGHAFEVTPRGEVVWDFWNPQVSRGERGVIYRMNRYFPEQVDIEGRVQQPDT